MGWNKLSRSSCNRGGAREQQHVNTFPSWALHENNNFVKFQPLKQHYTYLKRILKLLRHYSCIFKIFLSLLFLLKRQTTLAFITNKNKPKSTAKASDSTETRPPKDKPDLAVATIMEAIKASEQSVLTKIENTVTALATDLHAKILSLSKELHGEIATVSFELHEALENANQEIKLHATSIRSLEDGANQYSGRVVELETRFTSLTSQVKQLTAKTEDLESRQRRDNCRIIGMEESFGDVCMERSVASKLLQDSLGLDYTPALDRAHRSLQPKPKQGDPLRPIIIKCHYFKEKMNILRKASSQRPIQHNNKRIFIYLDYTAAVRKRRATFKEARELLSHCPNTRFGLLFPATLKITVPNGVQRSFHNPAEAKEYVIGHLQTGTQVTERL